MKDKLEPVAVGVAILVIAFVFLCVYWAKSPVM